MIIILLGSYCAIVYVRQGGRVIEVKAQPMVPLKQGDVILRINPKSAEFKITEMEAALAAAQQLVPQLKATWEQAKSQTQTALKENFDVFFVKLKP